ncbi:hypothetical protein [Mesorhizobium sp. 10J20-29]
MKRTSLITTTALIAGLMSAPAFALDVNAGGNVDAGAQVGGAGANIDAGANVDGGANAGAGAGTGAKFNTDLGTTASTSSDANFGMLISSLNASAKTAADIKAMTDVSEVTVVMVSDLEAGANAAAIGNAMSKNAEARADLQAAIEANTDLKAELENQSVDVSSVVAANIGAGGSLTVFVQ